ncbi:MAG TPA: hypothetical protein VE710_10195 [Candidatus Bathyarchaeia archaeon]|nr:hypothetical protein [Candidatus Bathyarchaeia archaeon]
MTIGVEDLFEQVLECTDALIKVCTSPNGDAINEERLVQLLDKREILIKALGKELENISDREKYRSYFDSYQQKESVAEQLLKRSLETLSQKLKDTQQSRSVTTNYDAYNRLVPYGAFIDHKK